MLTVDLLAQLIREVDGNHDKGAGALAEAILESPQLRNVLISMVQPLQFHHDPVVDLYNWYAYGVGEDYDIMLENGKYVFWAEGEGPEYDTLEEAKAAANADYVERTVKNVFGLTS